MYWQLRDALTVGRFDPGQALTIAAMADAFQTSHMPVREALRRLAAEGALEIRTNGSAHVPQVSRARLDDICAARTALERMAAELATTRISDAEIAELARITEAHAAVSDFQELHEMLLNNRALHFRIYRASGSEVLPPLIESLWLRYGPYMGMLSKRIVPGGSPLLLAPFARGHREIVAALRRRDAARAGQEVAEDIARTQRLLQAELARMD